MIKHKFAENIKQTGFILESRIVALLRKEGWTVISNKYYVDDSESSIREMDVLCYKVAKVEHIDIYTTLIISCKKSEKDIWALISRDINLKNPNYDWWPLHAWSNDKAISYELSQPGMAKKYHDDNMKGELKDVLAVPDYEVFAFQEMNKESGASKNDSNIFASIKSLIKAQAYEIGVLPQRKKSASVYQFSLVSVVDSELLRLMVDEEEEVSEIKIDSDQYLSRYIINKRESFSRIRFITAKAFLHKVKEYTALHQANTKWFQSRLDAFYSDVLKQPSKQEVLIEEFKNNLGWRFFHLIEKNYHTKIERNDVSLGWSRNENKLIVYLLASSLTSATMLSMNINEDLINIASKALIDTYRYHGKFEFVDDIPF